MELINEWKKLLDKSTYPPAGPFNSEWVSVGAGFPIKVLGNWDTPLIAHEILHLDYNRAKNLMKTYLETSLRKEDGMMAYRVVAETDSQTASEKKGPSFVCSHPPVWTFTARKILEKKWDKSFALFCLDAGAKNLMWWENNRMDRYGLFWYMDSFPENRMPESGYENSPRWNFVDMGPFPCVDLCCQILLHLENLKVIAEKLTMKEQAEIFEKKGKSLKTVLDRYLWDEMEEFYCDYDLTGKNAKKTISSYWALVSGLVPRDDVERFILPLETDRGFMGRTGLTSVPFADPSFKLDFWRGPMWLSQVFWICVGLQRYGFDRIAKKISGICLDNVRSVYKQTDKIWEFYNPVDGDMKKLTRNNSAEGPFPDYLGHNPIISLEKIREEEIL